MFQKELFERLERRNVVAVDLRGSLPIAWQWARRSLASVNALIVHYDAAYRPDSYDARLRYRDQASYHISKGWATLSYHMKVDGKGTLYLINDFECFTYHAGDANGYSIGVCFDCGSEQQPTKAQVKTLAALLTVITKESPEIPISQARVLGNREVWPTACPGDYLQAYVEEFRKNGVIDVGEPADRRYFEETGHWLSYGFKAFWEANGGLPIFGFPISEEIQEHCEDGHRHAVQYFERAVFEYHDENQEPYKVLLRRLGAAAYMENYLEAV